MKQTSDLKQDLCGKTQYFGDQWDAANGICYFKKCSEWCVDGSTSFEFGGQTYTRNEFCCKDKDYCNSSHQYNRGNFYLCLLCCTLIILTYIFLWEFHSCYSFDMVCVCSIITTRQQHPLWWLSIIRFLTLRLWI